MSTLEAAGGFAITHVARLTRTSGSSFTTIDFETFIDMFTYFLWLCAERRSGPVLPVGYDTSHQAVWARWSAPWFESYPTIESWLDTIYSGEAEALFPLFYARFQDAYWGGVLRHAIHYLMDAGRPQPVQRALIMALVLLESLSFSWLVEETRTRTAASFDDKSHSAGQNLRQLLSEMRIPLEVPAGLTALSQLCTRNGRPITDGPAALTTVRNAIVHHRAGTPSNLAAELEAWPLALRYCELALLRLCGFGGSARNRLSGNKFVGVVERVPWA
jgi:hypothetical protein